MKFVWVPVKTTVFLNYRRYVKFSWFNKFCILGPRFNKDAQCLKFRPNKKNNFFLISAALITAIFLPVQLILWQSINLHCASLLFPMKYLLSQLLLCPNYTTCMPWFCHSIRFLRGCRAKGCRGRCRCCPRCSCYRRKHGCIPLSCQWRKSSCPSIFPNLRTCSCTECYCTLLRGKKAKNYTNVHKYVVVVVHMHSK